MQLSCALQNILTMASLEYVSLQATIEFPPPTNIKTSFYF